MGNKNMKIEDTVCSLELSNRLKEIGVKQKSYFYWDFPIYQSENFKWVLVTKDKIILNREEGYVSAFTVAELGEMLPKGLLLKSFDKDVGFYYTQIPDTACNNWIIFYRNIMGYLNNCEAEDILEANARAKMLIYLLENKLMELPNDK